MRKFSKISVFLFILFSVLLFYFYSCEEDIDNSKLAINNSVENYLDSIYFRELSVRKSLMNIDNEDRQGLNFVLSYTLPDEVDISPDINIGLQIEFPDEYSEVLGGNMSAISYLGVTKTSDETSYLSYGIYPTNIAEENINKLLNTQYSFKINIVIDQHIIRELYIENS